MKIDFFCNNFLNALTSDGQFFTSVFMIPVIAMFVVLLLFVEPQTKLLWKWASEDRTSYFYCFFDDGPFFNHFHCEPSKCVYVASHNCILKILLIGEGEGLVSLKQECKIWFDETTIPLRDR